METAKMQNKTIRYSHTSFEWDRSPYGSIPDRVKMVHHFVTDPELEDITVEIEVGE